MKHIDLYYNKEAHVSRLLTGFHMLSKNGTFSIDFHENTNNIRHTPHEQVVEAVIDDKIIAFDMCDAFALNNPNGKKYLSTVELYFKRSYSPEVDKGHISRKSNRF